MKSCRSAPMVNLLRSVLLVAIASAVVHAQSIVVSADSAARTAMTLYSNAAIVRHWFDVTLPKGERSIRIERLPEMISPTSVVVRPSTADVVVTWQTLNTSSVSASDMLQSYVGRSVVLRQTSGVVEGELLAPPVTMVGGGQPCYVGAVIRTRSGELLVSPCGELVLPAPAPAVNLTPTLVASLVNRGSSTRSSLETVYQCDGLQWEATYTATLLDDRQLQLEGRVHILNSTRSSFRCDQLQLVAGSVNLRRKLARPNVEFMTAARTMAASDDVPAREQLDEYHLYTISSGATIAANTTTTLALRPPTTLPYVRRAIVWGRYYPAYQMRESDSVELAVSNVVEFVNTPSDSQPLPAGTVRVWRRDKSGTLQLLGEDDISHTPYGDKIALTIGDVFDLRAVRKEVNYARIADRAAQYTVEYTVRNGSPSARDVTVVESFAGTWTITDSTVPFAKRSSSRAEFTVNVPARGATTFRYTVRHSW